MPRTRNAPAGCAGQLLGDLGGELPISEGDTGAGAQLLKLDGFSQLRDGLGRRFHAGVGEDERFLKVLEKILVARLTIAAKMPVSWASIFVLVLVRPCLILSKNPIELSSPLRYGFSRFIQRKLNDAGYAFSCMVTPNKWSAPPWYRGGA